MSVGGCARHRSWPEEFLAGTESVTAAQADAVVVQQGAARRRATGPKAAGQPVSSRSSRKSASHVTALLHGDDHSAVVRAVQTSVGVSRDVGEFSRLILVTALLFLLSPPVRLIGRHSAASRYRLMNATLPKHSMVGLPLGPEDRRSGLEPPRNRCLRAIPASRTYRTVCRLSRRVRVMVAAAAPPRLRRF